MFSRQVAFGVMIALAAPATEAGLYRLEGASTFETGCFNGCDCPVFLRPLTGTFHLEFVRSDPLFDVYEVTDVDFIAVDGVDDIPITGAGEYRIGGEFARMHQLELDLIVGAEPETRYDSGLLVGGAEFPDIHIAVNMNNLDCFDTVLTLVTTAAPPCSGDIDGDGVRDLTDVALLLAEFGGDCTPDCAADLNDDGVVDLEDLSLLLAVFGRPCG